MNYSGMFYGYREWVFGRIGRIMLEIWELAGKVPHTLEVFSGQAADAYGNMVTFGGQSAIILVLTWDATANFQLSPDGSAYLDEFQVDPDKDMGGFIRRFAARGFRVKNRTPGLISRYELVAFR